MDAFKPGLSANFLSAVDTLLLDYNEEVYMKFLNAFGTHYIQEINMGSRFGQLSEFSKEGWKSMQSQSIDVETVSKKSGFFYSHKETYKNKIDQS